MTILQNKISLVVSFGSNLFQSVEFPKPKHHMGHMGVFTGKGAWTLMMTLKPIRQERKQAQVRGEMGSHGLNTVTRWFCRENTCRIYYRIHPFQITRITYTDTVDRGIVYIQWQWSTEL